MCNIENVNKISQFLKVSPGKLGYNDDKIVTRASKSNEILSGFTTIVFSLARESKEEIVKNSFCDLETKCQVSQWLDYSSLFVNPASRDKHVTNTLLNQLNTVLATKSYLVGNTFTLADLCVFYTIEEIINTLSSLDKENYINISRWFDHLQQNKAIRQGNAAINFSTIHLVGWTTKTHI